MSSSTASPTSIRRRSRPARGARRGRRDAELADAPAVGARAAAPTDSTRSVACSGHGSAGSRRGSSSGRYLRLRLEGRDRLPRAPAIYCFNHLNWVDPFVLMATLPMRPRLTFFGPKEEDMSVGGRNRLMTWTGATIPYRPGKNDLLEATRAGPGASSRPAVSSRSRGRGGSSRSSRDLGPLSEGAAYFALRERRAGRPDRDQRHVAGSGSGGGSGSGSASRSSRPAGRTARTSTR